MERNFHLKEEFAAVTRDSRVMTPATIIEDAYINGFFPELSFQSVLQPLSLMPANYYEGVSFHSQSQVPALEMASLTPWSYGFVTDEFPKVETWSHGKVLDQKLKMPKQEGLNTKDFAFELLKLNSCSANDSSLNEPLINFFATSPPSNYSLGMIDGTDFTAHFGHFSFQKSFGPHQPQTGAENKYLFNLRPPESHSYKSASLTMKRSTPSGQREAGTARKRRQRISDKMRCLEKLLPWNRRMDTATMLEEAYKYVKFLQAQIRILQSMPIHSSIFHQNPNLSESGGGGLARLNRQQLLKVVLNSPAAQTVLYSRGCCVYSLEQLLLLQQMAEKAAT